MGAQGSGLLGLPATEQELTVGHLSHASLDVVQAVDAASKGQRSLEEGLALFEPA